MFRFDWIFQRIFQIQEKQTLGLWRFSRKFPHFPFDKSSHFGEMIWNDWIPIFSKSIKMYII